MQNRVQGWIKGSSSYASDEVVFPSYELLKMPKTFKRCPYAIKKFNEYFSVDFDALSSP